VQESNSSPHLTPERMAAFSDGVIAVIITIMVLELKVPGKEISDLDGPRKVLPLLVIYGLSFIAVGIYWVNQHYMLDDGVGILRFLIVVGETLFSGANPSHEIHCFLGE
jgi:uncharacterized membrane protein